MQGGRALQLLSLKAALCSPVDVDTSCPVTSVLKRRKRCVFAHSRADARQVRMGYATSPFSDK